MQRRLASAVLLTAVLAPVLLSQQAGLTNLYTFTGGSDGGQPAGGLVANHEGSLFGVAQTGGTAGGGTVFELTPPASSGLPWTFAVIYNFQKGSGDGYAPVGPLVLLSDGSLIGTTLFGGPSNSSGTVFQLVPPTVNGGSWSETILYAFNGDRDGTNPGPIAASRSGALFGSLQYPGARQSGFGSVYELKKDSAGTWHKETIWVATDQNGGYPTGVLAFDSTGAIYGTSEGVSTYVYPGSVYQLLPPTLAGGTWTYNRLYTFNLTGNDGLSPIGGVIFGLNGALYGTTAAGGATGNGTVFSLAPPAVAGGSWIESVLYSFLGKADGSFPIGGLAVNKQGTLFGAAEYGGSQSSGTVFALLPPTSTSWTFQLRHKFLGGSDGQHPLGPVLFQSGVIYGTTTGVQDSVNFGTVYRISP